MKTITLFNNKGGVGKTTLAYHLVYMLAELGKRVLAVDLDPQANLSAIFLTEDRAEEIYSQGKNKPTIVEGIDPINRGLGDIVPLHIERAQGNDNIGVVLGDLELSLFEDKLSNAWSRCSDGDEAAFRTTTAFYRAIAEAAKRWEADYIVVDVGPNLGAINRAALIGTDYVIVPTAADLFSLQGLKNIGARLKQWRQQWKDRVGRNPNPALMLPNKPIQPIGYVVLQYNTLSSKPVQAYRKWANKIPRVFMEEVLHEPVVSIALTIENDSNCIAMLKNYYSLAPMSMAAKKPIFLLKPADGAIGAHFNAVKRVYMDFEQFTKTVLQKIKEHSANS